MAFFKKIKESMSEKIQDTAGTTIKKVAKDVVIDILPIAAGIGAMAIGMTAFKSTVEEPKPVRPTITERYTIDICNNYFLRDMTEESLVKIMGRTN